MGERWAGRQGSDAPPGRGGGGARYVRASGPMLAMQQDGHDAGGLGRQLQAAGGGERERGGEFGHDAGQAAMAQALLHHQQCRIAPGLGVYHAIRMQPGAGQAGRERAGESAGLVHHPQHGAGQAGEDACGEPGAHSAMLAVEARACNLVQRGAGQPALRQGLIQLRHAKWHGCAVQSWGAALQTRDCSTQLVQREAGRPGQQ